MFVAVVLVDLLAPFMARVMLVEPVPTLLKAVAAALALVVTDFNNSLVVFNDVLNAVNDFEPSLGRLRLTLAVILFNRD
jgi:hypothetical protein